MRPAREPLPMSELELDPTLLATLQALEAQDVEFVLVGDVAEAIYANGGFVSGVAIVPGAYSRNVGVSGSWGKRLADVTASGRSAPAAICGDIRAIEAIATCT